MIILYLGFIEFDQDIISYNNIINHFWKGHDPTTLDRQGPDIGRQYRSAIFYFSEEQRDIAEKSKLDNQEKFNNKIVTEITKADIFFKAEEYHQNFVQKQKIFV